MLATWRKSKTDPLLFEKELLPVGDLTQWVSDDKEIKHMTIRRPFLDHVVKAFDSMRSVGVRVPLFSTHVERPENDRGEVVKVYVKKNQKGEDSLFGHIRFNDEDAAKQGRHVDVSVGIPPKFVDGKGNRYMWPLRHVALTSKPVVPGLNKFEPIVLSFDSPEGLLLAENQGSGSMMELINQICAALDIQVPDGSNEEAALRLVLQKVKPAEADPNKGSMNLSLPPLIIESMVSARETTIDGLVLSHTITPARAAEWKKQYCTKEAVTSDIELSEDGTTCEFDLKVATAKEMAKDVPDPGPNVRSAVKLSEKDKESNPMLRHAERLRKKAAEKAKR